MEQVKKKREKRFLHHYVVGKDIKYRGPLSYRHLRIIAWLCIALSQIGVIMIIAAYFNKEAAPNLESASTVFSYLGSLMLPLLLVASFSIILNAKNGYRRLIILYSGAVVGVFLAFLYVYLHYMTGIAMKISGDIQSAEALLEVILSFINKNGFFTFNIFIDLLLCTLFTFFINYQPTKYFQGKKIIIFRLFALLPFLYEVVSLVLKIYAINTNITLNPYFYPFLTTKSPVMFAVFIALTFFIKYREHFFIKHGGNKEDYPKFLQTNANSFHFSVFATITFTIAAIIDLILAIVLVLGFSGASLEAEEVTEFADAVSIAMKHVDSLGIGRLTPFLIISPIFLLFSYTRTHKNRIIDIIIPIVGIVLILFVYLEGFYWIIVTIPTGSSSSSSIA